jgi:hypothetical protein
LARNKLTDYTSYLHFSKMLDCFSFMELLIYPEFIQFIFFNFMNLSVLCLMKISITSIQVLKHQTHLIFCALFYCISSIKSFIDDLWQGNLTIYLRLCSEFSSFLIDAWSTLMSQNNFSLFSSSIHYLSCIFWIRQKVAIAYIYYYHTLHLTINYQKLTSH